MKRRVRLWLVTVLSVAMVIGLLLGAMCNTKTGIAANKVSVTPAGQFPIVTTRVTLSAFIPQLPEVTDLANNDFTKWLEQKTNVHLNIVAVPYDSASDKAKLMLGSGDYPDIFMYNFSNFDILNYGMNEKIFIPLNSYIDKYGYELKKAFKEIPTLKQDMTAPDGKIYGIPQINQCYHCQAVKAWINVKWLKDLGLKMPTTTAELEKVLIAFKKYKPGAIPFSGATQTWAAEPHWWLMNSFIYCDGGVTNTFLYVKNGKVDTCANKQEYKEGLKYINKLYKEGLIDKAAFTQKEDQLKQLGSRGVLGAFAAGHLAMGIPIDDPKLKDYDVLPPVKGPKGIAYARWVDTSRVQGAAFVITNKCKYPEVAFRLGDFFYNDECTNRLYFGPKGKTWDTAGPNDKGLFHGKPYPAKFKLLTPSGQSLPAGNYRWSQIGPFRMDALKRAGWAQDWSDIYGPAGYEIRLEIATEKYKPFAPKELLYTAWADLATMNEIAKLQVPLQNYIQQSTLEFITGKKDIEKNWNAYVKQLEKLGIAKYIKLYQKAYDITMKKK